MSFRSCPAPCGRTLTPGGVHGSPEQRPADSLAAQGRERRRAPRGRSARSARRSRPRAGSEAGRSRPGHRRRAGPPCRGSGSAPRSAPPATRLRETARRTPAGSRGAAGRRVGVARGRAADGGIGAGWRGGIAPRLIAFADWPINQEDSSHMFVSKAAVLGGGTMGGEIAQVIANADIPVVVKDVEQKFVDPALEKSREVTKSQLDKLVSKEKLTQEQADARLDEVMGLITGTTTYEEFGDVDFVIEAVPERMEIKKSVYRELDEATPGHAILASNTSSLSITEMGRETLRPEQGRRLPLLLPGLGDAAGRDHLRRGHLARHGDHGLQLRPGDPQAADHLQGGPGLRRQPDPQLRRRRGLARAGGEGPLDQEDRRGDRGSERDPDGAVLPDRHARPRHRPARRRVPERVLRRPLLRPQGDAEARRRRQARRQVGRRGLLRERRAQHRGRRRAERRGARRPAHAEDLQGGLQRARGGHLHGSRDRPRHDGRRRPRPAARPLPALLEGGPRGPRHDPRADGEIRGVPRRALRAAADPEAARRPGPPRPQVGPGLLRLPADRRRGRRSSSRSAARSRSPGSPTRR